MMSGNPHLTLALIRCSAVWVLGRAVAQGVSGVCAREEAEACC